MKFNNPLSGKAKLQPKKIAVFDGAKKYSFEELDYLGACFSNRLLSLGLKKGDRIVVCAQKSADIVIAILGCLKAGGVFVPVDRGIPASRLNFIISDIKPSFIISSSETYEKITERCESLVHLDDATLTLQFKAPDTEFIPEKIHGNDIAYCIYTSGSTGNPKGVTITHANVDHFFEAMSKVMPLNENSRCMNTSELYFDVCIMDVFYPLYCGSFLYLYCERIIPEKLLSIIDNYKITNFTAVSPIITLLAKSSFFESSSLSSVSRIMTGAEIINVDAIQLWLNKVNDLTIINGYGPTEATVICCYYAINKREKNRTDFYPIGKAMPGSKLILWDEESVVSEEGISGELLIGGPQVMQGYWNDDEKTGESIKIINGERYYRSGDICKWLEEQNLYYIGRKDEEVKVSGFRIHLNEIKKLADTFEYIYEVYVIALDHPQIEKAVGLCFSLKPGIEKQENDLFKEIKSDLKSNLPYYMIPSLYFLFQEMPRLPSGKTDKKKIKLMSEKMISSGDDYATNFVFSKTWEEVV